MEKKSSLYSRATVKASLQLLSGDLAKIAGRVQNASNGIYGIEVISLLSGASKQQYEAAIAKVDEQLTVLSKAIEKRYENAKTQLEENLVTIETSYTNPTRYEIDIHTPTALRLVNAFKTADHLCVAYDKMWFAGLLTAEQRTSLIGDVMSSLRNITSFLMNANERSRALIEKSSANEPSDESGDLSESDQKSQGDAENKEAA